MTLRVVIADDTREVVVENDTGAPVAAVIADALTEWHRTLPRHRRGRIDTAPTSPRRP